MIDEYTLKKLQAKTGSQLKHKKEIAGLYLLLKTCEEKDIATRPVYKNISPDYKRYEINFSTLLRMFGLKEKGYVAKTENMDKLAHYLGYHSYRDIIREANNRMSDQYPNNGFSGFDDSDTVFSCCLQIGTKISFKYHEGRSVKMVYNGDNLFKVIRSVESRMETGRLYEIISIKKNCQLHCIDHVTGAPYACGKGGGIFDVFINDKPL